MSSSRASLRWRSISLAWVTPPLAGSIDGERLFAAIFDWVGTRHDIDPKRVEERPGRRPRGQEAVPQSGGGYRSPDYDAARNKVKIFIETGVGSVDIY